MRENRATDGFTRSGCSVFSLPFSVRVEWVPVDLGRSAPRFFHALEPGDGLSVDLDGLQEHRQGADPQTAVPVVLLVDDHFLLRFAVAGDP